MRLLCPVCNHKGTINSASKGDDVFFFCPNCGKVADMCIVSENLVATVKRYGRVKNLTSPKMIEEIRQYAQSGLTITEIAQIYGVSRPTLYRASKTNEALKNALRGEESE